MKYIPIEVVRNILNKCYRDSPAVFMSTMMPIDNLLFKKLSDVLEKTLDEDQYYLEWALNELKGVEYDDGNTE